MHPEQYAQLSAREGPKLLTVKEVCERLGISRSTLYLLFKTRALAFVKINGATRISSFHVDEFIASLMLDCSGQPENA